MTDIEIWKTAIVNGEPWENYQVSNFGKIMSLNYGRTGKSKLKRLNKTKTGYQQVRLSKNGKKDTFYVHRIVAETFLPNPENLPQVNHIDEDKTNNFVGTPENDYKDGNLEWKSHRDNLNHGTRNERAGKAISKANTNGKRSKRVLQFTLDDEFVREWPSLAECGRNGFCQGHVSRCCQGKRKSHKGFKWCYAEE